MTKNVLDPTITNWIKFNEDLMKLGLTSFVKQVTGYFSLFCYNNIMILKHFPHYRPLVRGLHQSLMESPNKGPCNMELWCNYTPAQRSWRGGILDSPCPSVCPSVCRRHGFRSISQVCFGISISNFICMLMVAIGRSLLIFSIVTFKMAAWRPYCIFWFPDSNFSLALNIKFKLQGHNTYVYG